MRVNSTMVVAGVLCAFSCLFTGCSFDPAGSKAALQRGRAKKAVNDNTGALQEFNRAIRLDYKNADAYRERGVLQLAVDRDDPQVIVDSFTKAIELNPGDVHALELRGLVRGLFLFQYDLAQADFDQTIKLDPRAVNAYYWSGQVRVTAIKRETTLEKALGMGRDTVPFKKDLIKTLDKALELAPRAPADLYLTRAEANHYLGNHAAASADFERARALDANVKCPW